MQSEHVPIGPSPRDWANAKLTLARHETEDQERTIYELRKTLVINGVQHVLYVWLKQLQFRSIGIDHGL